MSVTAGRNSEGTPCRLCMKKNDNYYYNIFTSNLASTMTVEDAIHELVGLRVAVDDGLPSALCPLCMEKLIEFSDFKKICLESDAELRKFSSRNYSRIIQGEGDGESGSSAVTKDCIPDAIMGPSRLACSVQTEIYIPLPECQTSRANMLKNGDQLSGGNHPTRYTHDPAQISSDVSDPLAIDDLDICINTEGHDLNNPEQQQVLFYLHLKLLWKSLA
ncbi:uncharacterized protein LOC124172102 [Ischnura elegans]|uniref:uncharacterized protein LOC124172091 n=1 Tax=Ischnura elegans TaxID=197161 RepID=UPI001ED872D3|nr:uncharacterized protein LOC124172091 [Ischnura elegans]XP_046407464.1 uncharacterized protein LOC124172102 [Ischnura elegans]